MLVEEMQQRRRQRGQSMVATAEGALSIEAESGRSSDGRCVVTRETTGREALLV